MIFRLKIIDSGSTSYTEWATETAGAVTTALSQARYNYPTGKISVERAPSPPVPDIPVTNNGITALIDDATPTLGGDLRLNGYRIRGHIESDVTVIDGGLL